MAALHDADIHHEPAKLIQRELLEGLLARNNAYLRVDLEDRAQLRSVRRDGIVDARFECLRAPCGVAIVDRALIGVSLLWLGALGGRGRLLQVDADLALECADCGVHARHLLEDVARLDLLRPAWRDLFAALLPRPRLWRLHNVVRRPVRVAMQIGGAQPHPIRHVCLKIAHLALKLGLWQFRNRLPLLDPFGLVFAAFGSRGCKLGRKAGRPALLELFGRQIILDDESRHLQRELEDGLEPFGLHMRKLGPELGLLLQLPFHHDRRARQIGGREQWGLRQTACGTVRPNLNLCAACAPLPALLVVRVEDGLHFDRR
eukprot:6649207-Prymnesium_polylepis.2